MRKIFINAHILRDPFLIGTLLIRVNHGHKMFPYILIRGVQAKPCWIRQELRYPCQFPTTSRRSSCPTKSRRLRGGVVGFEKDSSASQCRRFLLWMHSMVDEFFETDGFISCERV